MFAKEKLKKAAQRDSLTGLYNIGTAKKDTGNREICNAFFLMDVDDFKSINDTNGHMTGDSTLKKFASVRTNPFRFQEQIEVAREEFLFLSISVGAYVTDRRHTYEQYYEEADKALYETKKNEKNDYIVCMDVGSSVKIRRGAQAFAG